MRNVRLLFALLLVLAGAQRAAGQTVVAVDLDHAAFAYDDDHSLLEVYLAFGAATLPFEADAQGFRAQLDLNMSVLRSTEALLEGTPRDPVWQDTLTLSFVLPDTTGVTEGQYFVHQARLPVQPGEYELRVAVPGDAARGQQNLELRRDLLVPDFGSTDLVGLSDITLATTIAPSQDRDDLFYKNGLLVRPNANQLYGQSLNQLYYYAEVYHADAIASDEGKYTLLAYVAEANRPQPLPGLQKRSARNARTPDVLAGAFKIDELPSGSYFLRLALLNEDNESKAEQSRKFFVYNPEVERAQPVALEASFETSPYATMPEEEVQQGLKHIDLIATERERQRVRRIEDLDERRRFLMAFWQKRDPDASTPINEYRDAFYGRLQYVNERYTTSYTEGWKTDRGRVYIKYDAPAQIEPHLYDRDAHPYEIWQYNNIPGEGQAVFIFADTDGFGEFELLHSTVAGERKSANWQAELRK